QAAIQGANDDVAGGHQGLRLDVSGEAEGCGEHDVLQMAHGGSWLRLVRMPIGRELAPAVQAPAGDAVRVAARRAGIQRRSAGPSLTPFRQVGKGAVRQWSGSVSIHLCYVITIMKIPR